MGIIFSSTRESLVNNDNRVSILFYISKAHPIVLFIQNECEFSEERITQQETMIILFIYTNIALILNGIWTQTLINCVLIRQ